MRLTVGPLPPAVYWRRRAIVLGVAVLLIFAIVQSCSGDEAAPDDRAKTAPASQTAGPDPTVSVLRPQTKAPAPAPATQPPPTTATTSAPAANAPASGDCTDAEMSVIPVPAVAKAPRGATIDIRLKLKNVSKRTCNRDVGADVQEIYIKRGAATVWSSDKCGQVKGSEPREFPPNHEREYSVGWNGRDVTRCANNLANGPVPPAGDYQVFGRLGTKTSNPVKLTLT